jgi:hypothetical protein
MCFSPLNNFIVGGSMTIWILHVVGEAQNGKDANEGLLRAADIVAWVRLTLFC